MPTNKHSQLIQRDEHDETNLAKRVRIVAGSLATVDIQIGAVEIKDGTTDRRADVNTDNELKVAVKSGATVTPSGRATVSWESGATVAVSNLPDVDIDDISKGTQTNDVKVTLDSEAVVLGAGTAGIGFATVAVGSAATLNAVVNLPASQTVDWLSGATVAVSNLPATPVGTNYIGLATVDVGSALPAGTNYIGLATVDVGNWPASQTVDWLSGATVAVSNLPDVAIDDISKGTQTNDVKVTLDSEAVTLGAGTAAIGFATVSNPDHEYSYAYTSGPTTDWIVKGSAGFLHAVHVGTAVASSIIEVSDHASDGDAAVKLYQAGDTIGPAVYPLNMTMGTGITLDITNQTHVTIVYR